MTREEFLKKYGSGSANTGNHTGERTGGRMSRQEFMAKYGSGNSTAQSPAGSHEDLMATVAELTGGNTAAGESRESPPGEKEKLSAASRFSTTDVLRAANDTQGAMLNELFPQVVKQARQKAEADREERRQKKEEGVLYGYTPEEKAVIEGTAPQYTAAELLQAANDTSGAQYKELRRQAQIRGAETEAVRKFEQGMTDAELLEAYAAPSVKLNDAQMQTAKRLVAQFMEKYPFDNTKGYEEAQGEQLAAMMQDPDYTEITRLQTKISAASSAVAGAGKGLGFTDLLIGLGDKAASLSGDEDWQEKVRATKDDRTAVQSAAQAQQPMAYGAGMMGGKMAQYFGGKQFVAGVPGVGAALKWAGNAISGGLSGLGAAGQAAAGFFTPDRVAGLLGDQILDVAFDTIPETIDNLDLMRRQEEQGVPEEERMTGWDVAAQAAQNFGVNALFNLGSEAIPAAIKTIVKKLQGGQALTDAEAAAIKSYYINEHPGTTAFREDLRHPKVPISPEPGISANALLETTGNGGAEIEIDPRLRALAPELYGDEIVRTSDPQTDTLAHQRGVPNPEFVDSLGQTSEELKAVIQNHQSSLGNLDRQAVEEISALDKLALQNAAEGKPALRFEEAITQAEQIHRLTPAKQQELIGGIREALGDGVEVIDPGEKSISSLAKKIMRKVNQEGRADYDIFAPKDHTRTAVLLNSLEDVPNAIAALKQKFPGLTGEVFIDEPLNSSGYRGIHLTADLGDGIKGEIQISTPEAWAIKKQTDAIYDKWRNFDEFSLTDAQAAERAADYTKSMELWEEYYDSFTPEVRRMASSSVMGLESSQVPNTPLKGTQAPSINSFTRNSESGYARSREVPSTMPYRVSTSTPPSDAVISENSIPQSRDIDKLSGGEPPATPDHFATGTDLLEDGIGGSSVGAKRAEYVPEQKVSKVSSHTYADTPFLDDVSKNAANLNNIDPETSKFTYDVMTEKQSLREAMQRTGTPELLTAEKADLPTKMRFDGTDTDTAMIILHDATERAKETGDWSEVEQWAKIIQERGTEAGQRIQAFAKYTRTPEGTLVKAERMVQQYVEDLKKSDPKLFEAMQDLTDKLNQILNERTASIPQDMDEAVRNLREAVDAAVNSSKLDLGDNFTDELMKLFQEERLSKSQLEQLINEFSGVPEVTLDDIQQIMDIMTDAQKLPLYSKEREVIEQQAYKIIADKFDTSFAEKWNAWRYMAMLGNPTTHIRNVAGNTVFGAVTRIKNDVGALMEATIDRIRQAMGKEGINRTKALLNPFSEADNALKQAAKDDFANVYALVTGTGKKNPTRGIMETKTIFETPVLEKTRTLVSGALEAEDDWALKGAYADSLARWLKANDVGAEALKAPTEEVAALLDQGRAYAIEQAQQATFRDASKVATAINNFSHTNAATNIITEGILPFKKTPINIVKRGIEYSPAGLVDGIAKACKAVRKGSVKADEAIEALAKGLTGSGIMVLGGYLASQGLLTGAGSGNKKEANFEKLTGAQSYALNIGGKSYTLDWMAPAALPLFVGAELWNTILESDKGEFTFSDFADAMLKITEPVLDMTMLQGLNSTIQAAAYGGASPIESILTNAAVNYATQGIPTVLGKVARSVDDTRRTTYTDKTGFVGTLDKTWRGVMNRMPGLSQTNEPYVDQWGRTQENAGGSLLGRLAMGMLSPGYYSEDKTTEVDSILNQLYQETGETSVLPGYANKTWTQDGESHRYTPEEYTQVSQTRGQTAYSILEYLTPMYEDIPADQAVKVTGKAYDIANEIAKNLVVDVPLPKGTQTVLDWAEDQGGDQYESIATALFAKQVMGDVQGDKYPNGKTIPGSAKRKKIDALVEAGFTREEAMKIYRELE